MTVRFGQTDPRKASAAFTLVEVVMAMAILALVMAGMIYCYVESNKRAAWSAMSLVAQASAVEAVEQARAAQWDVHVTSTDQLPPTNYVTTNVMLIPATGVSLVFTNSVSIINLLTNAGAPPLRQILATCAWQYTNTGTWFSNTVVTWRAPGE